MNAEHGTGKRSRAKTVGSASLTSQLACLRGWADRFDVAALFPNVRKSTATCRLARESEHWC